MMAVSYTAQKKKLYETVIEQVDRLLSSGDYVVGDKLPSIDELSRLFSASKPTLREAFSVLASTGVLEISHGRGVFIKSLAIRTKQAAVADFSEVTGTSLLHWLEFRRTIEVESAALAAERRTDADVARLEQLVEAIGAKLDAGENAEDLDYEFHVAIANATRNPIYANALKTQTHALQHRIFEDVRQSVTVPARKLLIMQEHRKILESIKKQDAVRARRAMETHLLNAERKLRLLNDDSAPPTQ